VLLFGVLEVGALVGAQIRPEDIEKIMNVMHSTKVVQVQNDEDDHDQIKPDYARRLPP
jgi:exoribonuclease II